MKQHLPEPTNNISLAVARHICGAPIIRAWRKFTPESLQKLGFRTIEEAHAKRAQGKVELFNQHVPKLREIDAICDRVSALDSWKLPDLYVKDGDDYRRANELEIAATIATTTLKLRAEVIDSLSEPGNYLLETVSGEVSVDKSDPDRPVITFPGRTIISANASEATKERLS